MMIPDACLIVLIVVFLMLLLLWLGYLFAQFTETPTPAMRQELERLTAERDALERQCDGFRKAITHFSQKAEALRRELVISNALLLNEANARALAGYSAVSTAKTVVIDPRYTVTISGTPAE